MGLPLAAPSPRSPSCASRRRAVRPLQPVRLPPRAPGAALCSRPEIPSPRRPSPLPSTGQRPSTAAPRRPLAHSPAPQRFALPARLPFRPASAEPGTRSLGSPAEAGGGRRGGGDPRRVPASPPSPSRPRLGLESPPVAQPVGGAERRGAQCARKGGGTPLKEGGRGEEGAPGGEQHRQTPRSHFPTPASPFCLRKGQECL